MVPAFSARCSLTIPIPHMHLRLFNPWMKSLDIRNRIVSILCAKLLASDLQVSYSQGQN